MSETLTPTTPATTSEAPASAPAPVVSDMDSLESSASAPNWGEVDFTEADLDSAPASPVVVPAAVPSATQPVSVTPAPAAPAVPQVVQPVQPQQAAAPVAQSAPTEQPSQQPQANTQQQVATAEPPAQTDALSAFVQKLDANEDAVIGALTQQRYALDAATVEAIQTSPETVIPTLMARTHVNVVKATLGFVAQQLPTLIEGLLEARTRHSQMEDKFFTAWPQIDRQQHAQQVNQFAQMYRAMNPKATAEEAIRAVGAQVVVALGLTAPAQRAAAAPQMAAMPAPFVPAAVSSPPAGVKPQPGNLFEMYNQMILQEEENG